jgi:hypothetical protein
MTFGGGRERFRNHELPGGHPAISWTLAPEIGDALWQPAKKLLSGVTTKKHFVGVAVQEKSQPRVQPGFVENLQIFECRVKIKGRKHGKRFIEFFGSPAVVEKEQAVHEGTLSIGDEETVGAQLGLEVFVVRASQSAGRSDAVVGQVFEDDVLPRAEK